MSDSVGTTYQSFLLLAHRAANDNQKDPYPMRLYLTNEGALPECPDSVTIDIKVINSDWLAPIKHEVMVRLRAWCTDTYGPEAPTSWRLMSSGFIFFAQQSDATMFWMAWHQAELTL